MIEDRPIILGCDDHRHLHAVLDRVGPAVLDNYILVSRSRDIVKIIKSSNPALVIILFRDNQQVMQNIFHHFHDIKIPILCLLRRFENKYIQWNGQDIVFTHSLESLNSPDSLSSKINSILLLIKNSKKLYQRQNMKASHRDSFVSNNSELARYVLELDQKNQSLLHIKKRITDLFPSVDANTKKSLLSIVNSIQTSKRDKKTWKNFKLYFENINPVFIKQLSARHPALTPMDIKYCCFLKMNMSTDEIRNIFGISQESVRTHKYRLKKKLDLPKKQDLLSYIISFPRQDIKELA